MHAGFPSPKKLRRLELDTVRPEENSNHAFDWWDHFVTCPWIVKDQAEHHDAIAVGLNSIFYSTGSLDQPMDPSAVVLEGRRCKEPTNISTLNPSPSASVLGSLTLFVGKREPHLGGMAGRRVPFGQLQCHQNGTIDGYYPLEPVHMRSNGHPRVCSSMSLPKNIEVTSLLLGNLPGTSVFHETVNFIIDLAVPRVNRG